MLSDLWDGTVSVVQSTNKHTTEHIKSTLLQKQGKNRSELRAENGSNAEIAKMLVKSDKKFDLGPAKKIDLGKGFWCLVSPEDYEWINRHKWYAKKSFYRYYAVRRIFKNLRPKLELMHRRIAQTPADMICHHNNGNSLDNRRGNLLNMTYYDHKILHSWR
ncbi:hypothetical protein ES703_57511 [subsurface metagenome]